jgi:hypothetical protein
MIVGGGSIDSDDEPVEELVVVGGGKLEVVENDSKRAPF